MDITLTKGHQDLDKVEILAKAILISESIDDYACKYLCANIAQIIDQFYNNGRRDLAQDCICVLESIDTELPFDVAEHLNDEIFSDIF